MKYRVTLNWTNHRLSTAKTFHEETATLLVESTDEATALAFACEVITAGFTVPDIEIHEHYIEAHQ